MRKASCAGGWAHLVDAGGGGGDDVGVGPHLVPQVVDTLLLQGLEAAAQRRHLTLPLLPEVLQGVQRRLIRQVYGQVKHMVRSLFG